MSEKCYALLLLVPLVFVLLGCMEPPSIDKVGGTRLVYKIAKQEKSCDAAVAKKKLLQRLDPSGKLGIQVELADGKVEISVPHVDGVDLELIQSRTTNNASLALLILADLKDAELVVAVEKAESSNEKVKANVEIGEKEVARWVSVSDGTGLQPAVVLGDNNLTRKVDGKLQVLCRLSEFDVSDGYFESASKSFDDRKQVAIDFELTKDGARRMAELTAKNIGRRLGIVLADRVVSAPMIQSPIQERGQITGSFTEEEVDDLVRVLVSGPLPFKFSTESPQGITVAPP